VPSKDLYFLNLGFCMTNFKIRPCAVNVKEVALLIGVSKSTVYEYIKPTSPSYKKDFPRPFSYSDDGGGPSRWKLEAIQEWVENCSKRSKGGNHG
jgi:predicted DNA-binding transcriptional regulator AlpA